MTKENYHKRDNFLESRYFSTKNRNYFTIFFGVLSAVLILISVTALMLSFIHITDFPYVIDFDALKIGENTGIEKDEAFANYAAVMDYLSPFSRKDFSLPSMKWSESGAGHFEDCKVIFRNIYLSGFISIIIILFICFNRNIRRTVYNKTSLLTSGILTILMPFGLLGAIAVNFDKAFVIFHNIFFRGKDNWIFDYQKDPIINILPAEFFMHCAVIIAIMWVLAGVLQIVISRRLKGKKMQN